MNLSRMDLAKEVYHKLKESHPNLSLKTTDAVIREFLHTLGENVLVKGKSVQLRPYVTVTRKTRRGKKFHSEYVHFKAGKEYRRAKEWRG